MRKLADPTEDGIQAPYQLLFDSVTPARTGEKVQSFVIVRVGFVIQTDIRFLRFTTIHTTTCQ
jgi:hypothetical protein